MMCHILQTVYLYIIYFPLTELEVELNIFVTDACLVRNCSHFCTKDPYGTAQCSCPSNSKLGANQKDCVGNLLLVTRVLDNTYITLH